MKNKNLPGAALLRMKAEEQFKMKHSKRVATLTESGIKKLLYELEVHQIELELQNQELQLAIDKANTATDLYDFSPSGYFTLEPDGIISQMNFSGARLLGLECSFLVNRNIRTFISPDTLPVINDFLQKVFETNSKVICEVRLLFKGNPSAFVHLEGYFSANVQKCLVTAVDITRQKQAELELLKEKHQFKTIIDASPVSIWFKDSQNNFIRINEAAARIAKRPVKEVEGRSADEIFPSESVNYYIDDLEVINSGNSKLGIIEPAIINGVTTWVRTDKIPWCDTEGNIAGIIAFALDITDRIGAEVALRENEVLLRTLVQAIPDLIWLKDSKGVYLSCNTMFERFFGAKEIEIVGKTDYDFVDRELADFFREHDRKAMKAGKSISNEEWITFADDGHRALLDTTKTPMYDSEGMLIGVLGIAHDITKRKQADEKIKTLGKAIEQGPSSIVITNADGKIEFVNDKFTQMTQYQLEDVKGKNPRIFNPGRLPGNEFEALWETLRRGNTWKGEVLNRRKDKSEFWEDISISALMNDDGTISNYILIMDDITEKKQMMDDLISGKEKAEESDRLKTAFLATMNHELRTPLNHILGFSELIMSGVTPEDDVSFASSIQSSGQSLLSIIEGVFDLAIVEQEHIKLREQTFSLMDHFMESKASFDNILINSGKNENICLVFKPDTRWLTSYVTADRSKINQVLTNLFKNAVKFTHQGKIEFGYKVENESHLMFYVKDTGIGIPVDKQCVIFDFFRQGDDSSKRVYGGIGIGLAISQKITNILNGELKVASEPGTGSTFSLTIPVELSENKGG